MQSAALAALAAVATLAALLAALLELHRRLLLEHEPKDDRQDDDRDVRACTETKECEHQRDNGRAIHHIIGELARRHAMPKCPAGFQPK